MRLLVHHVLVLFLFQPAWKHGVPAIHQLVVFSPRHLDIPRIRYDDVITAVDWPPEKDK